MARLIDADMLQVHILNLGHRWDIDNADYICEVIENQTTIDAEPIRHGHWYEDEQEEGGMTYTYVRCNNCGEFALSDSMGQIIETPFCPWCGAKMDISGEK